MSYINATVGWGVISKIRKKEVGQRRRYLDEVDGALGKVAGMEACRRI
jgi:hypothetical protein